MSRKIKHAHLHASLFIPLVGHLGEVLPPTGKTFPDLSMESVPEGVLLKVKGVECVIPWPNIRVCTFYPEEPKGNGK